MASDETFALPSDREASPDNLYNLWRILVIKQVNRSGPYLGRNFVSQNLSFPRLMRTRIIFLSLVLVLGIILPLLLVNSIAICKSYFLLKNEAAGQAKSANASAVRAVWQWLGLQLENVKSVTALVSSDRPDSAMNASTIKTALQSQQSWREILIVDAAGKIINAASRATSPTRAANGSTGWWTDKRWTDKELLVRVCHKRQSTIASVARTPLTNQQAIVIGAPIVPKTKLNALPQALIVAIAPSSLKQVLHGLNLKSGSVLALVDSKNQLVSTLEDQFDWSGTDFFQPFSAQASLAAKRALQTRLNNDRTARTYSYLKVPSLNWSIVVGTPTQNANVAARHWLFGMLGWLAFAVTLSLLFAYASIFRFSAALDLLLREAVALTKGDFSRRVRLAANSELKTLADTFNQMAARLELDQQQKFMVERLSGAIRQSLDLNQILDTTVRELGKALESSRCCLALIDENARYTTGSIELVFNHVWHDPEKAGAPLAHRSILVTPKSVMSLMLEQGSILSLDLLADNNQTPLFENKGESLDDWDSIRSLIACPIIGDNGPVGIILVHQCNQPRIWTNAELELVETISRHVVLAMHHARLYNRTKNMAEQEMLINHIVRSLRSSLDLDTILNTVTQELAIALQADRCQIAQPRPEAPLLITHEYHAQGLRSTKGVSIYSEAIDCSPESDLKNLRNNKNCVLGINMDKLLDRAGTTSGADHAGETIREAPIAVIHDTRIDSRTLPFQEFVAKSNSRSIIAAPLISENRLNGLLVVHQCREYRLWKAHEIQLIATVADQLAIAVAHASLFAQVKQQAITDGLTGLYNHVYFKNRLSEEIKLAQRKGTACSLLMLDLDHLKGINDQFGHPVGDAAIRQVALVLKTALRSGDTAARYGGEEFAVILPETPLLEAALIADRICSAVANSVVPGLGKVTVSIGSASYPRQAKDPHQLISMADKALYSAKQSGRNKIRVYDEAHLPLGKNESVLPRLTMVSQHGRNSQSIKQTHQAQSNLYEKAPGPIRHR
jgi:diguanylate cyclase (GGDEF)-like protein